MRKIQLSDFKVADVTRYFSIFMVGAAVGVGLFMSTNQGPLNQLGQMAGGVSTCFARLTQTFTARMIRAKNSEYLGDSFKTSTESCFSDVINVAQTEDYASKKRINKKLNILGHDAHWFHKKVSESSNFSKGEGSNFSERYYRLENQVEDVVEMIESSTEREKSFQNQMMWTLFACLMLALALQGVSEWMGRAQRAARVMINGRAEELVETESLDPESISEVIDLAMEEVGMSKVGELYSHYHSSVMGGKIKAFIKTGDSEVDEKKLDQIFEQETKSEQTEATNTEPTLKTEAPNEVETDSERPEFGEQISFADDIVDNLQIVNLSKVVNDVSDMLSDRMFGQGIVLDFEIDQEIFVYAQNEAIVQVIFNLLSNAIDSCTESGGGRKIGLRTKVLGGVVLFKISDTGTAMSSETVQFLNGEKIQADLDPRIEISREFMSEFGGNIVSKYRRDEEGNTTGNIIELVFHRVDEKSVAQTQAKTKQVRVVKGKKAEVLEQLRVEANPS